MTKSAFGYSLLIVAFAVIQFSGWLAGMDTALAFYYAYTLATISVTMAVAGICILGDEQ